MKTYPHAPGAFKRMAIRNRFKDTKAILKVDRPIIVDGGSHRGECIHIFSKNYPGATIHAFEPTPELARFLREKFAALPKVHIHEVALGADNKKVVFNIMNRSGTSSILDASDILSSHRSEIDPKKKIKVQCRRLDNMLSVAPHLVKLDLQGYELEALKGFGKLLNDVRVIHVEVEFVKLYKNQPLFAEIDQYLRKKGFQLFNLYELWTRKNGQLTTGDAVYLNSKYYSLVR